MRHRRRRVTSGKVPVKHSSSLVGNTGQGVGSVFAHIVYETTVGDRLVAGGIQTIKDTATTERDINVGDIVKYANICLQASPRGANPTNDNDNAGWLEWAVCWQQERAVLPAITNLGVATLGVICSHVFRENCLLTGCFPIGTKQAMAQDIKIKLPERCCRVKMGANLQCFCFVRTSSSTDVRTDSHRLMVSSHFKCYS